MRLDLLVKDVPAASVHGRSDIDISAVVSRHDAVTPGAIFVAVRGFTHDGHAFVSQAISRGAAAVVVERPGDLRSGVVQVQVPDSRLALALLSSAFYGHPSRQLKVIGITGTNGKGTTAYLIEALLTAAGRHCGIIGTMGAKMGEDRTIGLDRTTPEALDLQRLLRQMVDEGMQYAVVEVASHALTLHRVAGTRFMGAVFTNLTQDHLDFHKTLDEYRAAKRRLFEVVEPGGLAVVNADDPSGAVMAAASRAHVMTYGIDHPTHVRAAKIRLRLDGMDYSVITPDGNLDVASRLQGRFNVYNSLAAITLALAEGVPLATIPRVLSAFAGVPGRFEAVNEGQKFGVVVDYAHTPDGLENVLRTARDFVRGRTIVVFGAGGDRDRTKRRKMGAIASDLADMVIVTSDNPRTEQPMAIIEEILAGIADRARPLEVEPDRRKAIFRAIQVAEAGDFVIIAGKGHEPYQEINGVKHPFDDRLVAREALKARAAHA
jgi:UDP-N-acetylmuramoyl-L-alanyl-D-glutamate--2,6-diaminopimelate ligase